MQCWERWLQISSGRPGPVHNTRDANLATVSSAFRRRNNTLMRNVVCLRSTFKLSLVPLGEAKLRNSIPFSTSGSNNSRLWEGLARAELGTFPFGESYVIERWQR